MKALTRELLEVIQRNLATGLIALVALEIAYAGVALQSVRGYATSPPPQGNNAVLKHKDLHWSPPDVDAVLPGISGIVPCALPTALGGASERAVELLVNLENFTAKERIEYIKQDDHEALEERDASVFDYTFGFETRGDGRSSQEYRTVAKGGHALSASGQDTGLAALALIFLPSLQGDYDMRCEGVDKWSGQLAYVVHFQQRKDKPGRTLLLRTDTGVFPVMLRGRAWISMENSQVLHLETNSMSPIPRFKLRSNALAIDYGLVRAHSKNLELWLPQYIEAYWVYETYRMVVSHTLTDFQVFTVETEEKFQPPTPH